MVGLLGVTQLSLSAFRKGRQVLARKGAEVEALRMRWNVYVCVCMLVCMRGWRPCLWNGMYVFVCAYLYVRECTFMVEALRMEWNVCVCVYACTHMQ